MAIGAIIVAAGIGRRFGSPNKVFTYLAGKPILIHALEPFEGLDEIDGIWIATRKEMFIETERYIREFKISKVKGLIEGGIERQDSVYNALRAVPNSVDIVLIHDAARPLLSYSLIKRVLEALKGDVEGVVPGVSLADTIKWISKKDIIGGTLNRDILRAIQTPQAFWKDKLLIAYERAYMEGFYGTDDASLIERYGGSVRIVEGEDKNIKITTPNDLRKAENLIKEQLESFYSPKIRIGIGYDSHRFAQDRKLIIGGVLIPFEKGLAGHSDADVLTHAVIDALLGSAGLGDIGKHFPDTDPQYKDISSLELLNKTLKLLKNHGFMPLWLDCTIFAEKPKMSPYIPEMIKNYQKFGLRINIKAKTNEGMGFIGRKEGIAAQAICLSSIYLDS